MTNLTMADTLVGRIDEAAKADEWATALVGAERVLACVANGLVAGDFALAEAMAGAAAATADRVALRGDVAAVPGPEAVVWLMRAVAAIAEVGRNTMRRPDDGDTRTRILARLSLAGPNGMSSSELGAACSRSPETVSRMLRTLRGEGAVESVSAGRTVRSFIAGARQAPVGMGAVVASAHAVARFGREATDWPDVDARALVATGAIVDIERHEAEPVANEAVDVRGLDLVSLWSGHGG